jgi:hypothetical protein
MFHGTVRVKYPSSLVPAVGVVTKVMLVMPFTTCVVVVAASTKTGEKSVVLDVLELRAGTPAKLNNPALRFTKATKALEALLITPASPLILLVKDMIEI